MLHWRLLLGFLFIGALTLLFWFDIENRYPGLFLFPLALLIALLAVGEIIQLITFQDLQPVRWTVYVGTIMVVGATGVPHFWPEHSPNCPLGNLGWPLLAFVLAMMLAIAGEGMRFAPGRASSTNLSLAIFAIFYIGILMSFVVQLRFVGGSEWNGLPLIAMLIVVKSCDIGAYTVGRLIGKHKLAPMLSPGKTIEGLVGGILVAIAGSWFAFSVLPVWIALNPSAVPLPWWRIVTFGLLVGSAGILGDLLDSMLKRCACCKDSSSWMPGFGGILDLLDSPLLAAPVAYLLWVICVP